MKKIVLAILGAALLAGCAHRYDVTLTNGLVISHVSKPKLDKENGVYHFKDVRGTNQTVSASRVVQIEPHVQPKNQAASP
jgi:hypothetical protein